MKEMLQIVRDIILENSSLETIDDTESLYQKGIDSIEMLYIINEIENVLNIRIPDDELLISNFETVQQISTLIERLSAKESSDEFEDKAI